jgi:HemK-related putative methylase
MSATDTLLCALQQPPDSTWVRTRARLQRWCYQHSAGARSSPVVERVANANLVVLPGVMHPRWMRTGAFLAAQLSAELTRNRDVLDMGSGSGVCTVIAARHARQVVAVDIDSTAARCTQINALLNGVEERVQVLQGDLFAPLGERRFDLVLFNPPFLRGEPVSPADRAWRSPDVAERFAAALPAHLKTDGHALVLLSSYGGGAAHFLSEFRRVGLEPRIEAQGRYFNERLALLRVAPRPQGRS